MSITVRPVMVVVVTRTASVVFVGHITRSTNITLPVACHVYISDNNHAEYATRNVVFQGNTGTCVVPIHFKWAEADPSDPVDMAAYVEGSYAASPTISSYRESYFPLPSIPLPAEGEIKKVSFNTTL